MKRNNVLVAAVIVATLSFIFFVAYVLYPMFNKLESMTIGSLIFVLFAIISVIALIFVWVGYGTNKRGFVLTAGILYAVAMVLIIPIFYYSIVQMILCFVAYGLMGKDNGKT